LRANALRARSTLLVELVRTRDRILTPLGALEAAQFSPIGAAQATIVGLLLKLLETGLVALRAPRLSLIALRVLRRLLGSLQLAELATLGAAERPALGLQLIEATLSLVRDRIVATGR